MKDGQNSSRFSKLSSFKQRPESRNHQENRMFMTRMLSPSPYTKPRKSTFIKSVSDLDKNSESKTATKDCETTETWDSDFDIDISTEFSLILFRAAQTKEKSWFKPKCVNCMYFNSHTIIQHEMKNLLIYQIITSS